MKQQAKRFFALLLAMAMCLSLAAPAWATEVDPADEIAAESSEEVTPNIENSSSETSVESSAAVSEEEAEEVPETAAEESAEEVIVEEEAEEAPAEEETLEAEEAEEETLEAADYEDEVDDSCGDNVKWSVEDGTLTISGTGEMWDDYVEPEETGSCWWKDLPWEGQEFTRVVIEDGVTTIAGGAFWGEKITSVSIPDSVTSIGNYAFMGCTALTSIDIPDSVTKIWQGAFQGCTGLTSIDIPDSVTAIGWYAFEGCTGLTSVDIPDSVTNVGQNAFYGCTSLTSVSIGSGVTSLGDYVTAFIGCDSLTSISVSADNAAYCSVDGVLFNKGKTTLVRYPAGKQGAYTIPSGVKTIEADAFSDCDSLTSVTIPSSVTAIEAETFCNLSGLTSATVLSQKAKIGGHAFGYSWSYDEAEGEVVYTKVSGFVLIGYSGSTAQTYAQNNGITFRVKGMKYNNPNLSSVTNAASGVVVKWGAVTGAAKYRVFRKTGSGKWAKLADTTKTSYTDKSAKSGTTYTYTVRCISSNGKTNTSGYNTTGKTICRLSSVTLSSVKNVKSKKMKVKWKKNTSGSGYQIQYSTNKNFSGAKTVTVSKNKTTSKTISKLTKKKTYYVRIRTYKKVGKATYYSGWSGAKSVIIKK